MNHDVCHCYDYVRYVCPKDCYRAKVTQDLKDNYKKYDGRNMSFANFKGTPFCLKWPKAEDMFK